MVAMHLAVVLEGVGLVRERHVALVAADVAAVVLAGAPLLVERGALLLVALGAGFALRRHFREGEAGAGRQRRGQQRERRREPSVGMQVFIMCLMV